MQSLPALFGLGCMASIAFGAASDDDDAVPAALLLTIGWAASNCAWLADGLRYLPMLDVALTAAFFASWRVGRQGWLLCLWLLGASQLAFHVVYAVGGSYRVYAWALNLTFAAQLAAVSYPGGREYGGRISGAVLRGFRRLGSDPSPRVDA
jgi:hypothetical protein